MGSLERLLESFSAVIPLFPFSSVHFCLFQLQKPTESGSFASPYRLSATTVAARCGSTSYKRGNGEFSWNPGDYWSLWRLAPSTIAGMHKASLALISSISVMPDRPLSNPDTKHASRADTWVYRTEELTKPLNRRAKQPQSLYDLICSSAHQIVDSLGKDLSYQ
jgi:hypothetical protein